MEAKEIQLSSVAQKRPRGKSHGPLLFSQQNQRYQKSNDRKEIKKWEMVWRRGNRGWDGDEVRVEEAFFFIKLRFLPARWLVSY